MAVAEITDEQAPLKAEELLNEARSQTGLSDFGDDLSFMSGFRELVAAVEAMDPPPQLRASARGTIVKILSTRLRMAEDDKRYPEIAAQDVGAPLIVCGLPRTGTTITYDLLCLDPVARAPTEWEWYIPWPPPEEATFKTDPRIAQVQSIYENWLKHAPQLNDIQRMDCTQPGECNHGMMMHFASTNFPAELGVPEFAKWLLSSVAEGQYRTHKRLLQQFQWKGPKGRWTLKSPQHLFDLPGVVEAYPGAMLVWTHRDPVLTFSSLASMIVAFLAAVGADKDLKAVGRGVFETWSEGLNRGLAAREARPDIAERIIDLGHSEVVADPMGSVQRVYDKFDLPFTDEHKRRITAFLSESNAAKRLGRHQHSAEQFGIDPAEVHERLAHYYEQFGHLLTPVSASTGKH